MRGHTATLTRAGAAVAGPSSGGAARTALLRQSRHFATHADSSTCTYASPPLFQDLINEAMKPTSLHSALLLPAPRKQQDGKASKPQRSPQLNSKDSGSALAKASEQLAQATGSRIQDNRAPMIIRLIRYNRILSAMAAFEQDIANPCRKPFTVQQLEDVAIALRVQSKKHATTRPSPKQSHSIAGELWRPRNLDPSIPAKSLSIPAQCMYAMAAIYDVCTETNGFPTTKMVSAMLASLMGYSHPSQLCQAADAALGHLAPATMTDQAACLRHVNHRALSAFITTYGSARRPEKGEALLERWTKAQRVNGMDERGSMLHVGDESIDLTGWGQNVVMWQSLIKSRVDAGDLYGARKWLDRYRAATQCSIEDGKGAAKTFPPIKPEPYLAYMAGIRRKVERARPGRGWVKRVIAEVRGAIGFMIADRVPIESSVLAFVIDFEVRVGNVDGSAKLIRELGGVIEDRALQDSRLLRALLRFRAAAADARENAEPWSDSGSVDKAKYDALPSVRSLIRSLVLVGDGKAGTDQENIASARSRGTLNEALKTAMAERDYPAAVVVLNLFERWRIIPSPSTYMHVIVPVINHGHIGALRAAPGDVTVSASKTNVYEAIKSLARDLDSPEEAARVMRLAADEKSGDTTTFPSQPTTRLRQTQYLVRVLNRACGAELKSRDPERVVPAWLAQQREAEKQDGRRASLFNRIRSTIFAAQDELLGKRDERDDGKLSSKNARKTNMLFDMAPLLSTNRRGMDALVKPKPKPQTVVQPVRVKASGTAKRVRSNGRIQDYIRISAARSAARASARAFSTSAAPRADTGASCDLASAAKGDFSHLEPVRTIYIPGFVPYDLGLALQEHLVKQRADARAALRALADTSSTSASSLAGHSAIAPSSSETRLRAQADQDTLLLLQHRPVYTEGRRHDSEDSLVATHLRSLGADYHLTKRGGQITYHGPGQLVGYPILNLASMGLASRCYVDRIQDSLISLLAARGVETVPPPDDHTGVWADEYHKIASIGIQVRHRISSHGFALNVEKRAMMGFKHIVACGIVGRSMTCLQDRLDPDGMFAKYAKRSDADPREGVESVARAYKEHFARVFGREVRDVTDEEVVVELADEAERERLRERLGVEVGAEEGMVCGLVVDGQRVKV